MQGANRVIKNGLANIINGFSNILLGVVMAPFLIRSLSLKEFSTWSIVIQIAALFTVIGYALQLVTGRFITLGITESDKEKQANYLFQGLLLSLILFFISFIISIIVYYCFADIFHDIDVSLITPAKECFLFLAVSFCLGTIASVYVGYFIGCERNEVPAIVNLVTRINTGIIIVCAAKLNLGLIVMGALYAIMNLLSYAAIYIYYKCNFWQRSVSSFKKKSEGLASFTKFFFDAFLINIAMFLITGMTTLIIGRYDFEKVAYFSIAMSLVNAFIGLISAAISPFLQTFVIVSLSHKDKVATTFIKLTNLIIIFVALCILLTKVIAPVFLSLWIGSEKSQIATPVLQLMLACYAIRLIGLPLGLLMMAKGKTAKIAYGALAEGGLVFIICLLVVRYYSVTGVFFTVAGCATLILTYYIKIVVSEIANSTNENKIRRALWLRYTFAPILLLVVAYIISHKDESQFVVYSIYTGIIVTALLGFRQLISLKREVDQIYRHIEKG